MHLCRLSHVVAVAIALFVHTASAPAQEPNAAEQSLQIMRRHVGSLKAVGQAPDKTQKPLELLAAPVLRYSDPGGVTTDASIWAWQAAGKGRPQAMAGIFFLTLDTGDNKWSCELLSLADRPVTVRSGAGWSWSPADGDLEWFTLADKPGDTDKLRLRQMKDIARRYEVTTTQKTLKNRMRLMVQPLHRYADEEAGLLDGAIFAYAEGTNPESLLLIECRKGEKGLAWHAAFARFGANACTAALDDTVVWTRPAVDRWDPKSAYFSRFGAAWKVFEIEEPGNSEQPGAAEE